MSTEYSDRKIKELLAKTNGQSKLAEQAIHTLAQRDLVFLHSLVQPYLNGIISHAIERAHKSTGIKKNVPSPLPRKAVPQPPVAASKLMSGNAMDNLMKAWASKFETDEPQNTGCNKVSQNHIDVLKSLVKPKKY